MYHLADSLHIKLCNVRNEQQTNRVKFALLLKLLKKWLTRELVLIKNAVEDLRLENKPVIEKVAGTNTTEILNYMKRKRLMIQSFDISLVLNHICKVHYNDHFLDILMQTKATTFRIQMAFS